MYLSFLIFFSELGLLIVKHSRKSESREKKDRGSLVLIWISMFVGITVAFNLADFRIGKGNKLLLHLSEFLFT